MKNSMNAFRMEAKWKPKKNYSLNVREKEDKRAFRADFVYKDITAGIKNINIPQIHDDEVLIRVGACGVCGTDLHVLGEDEEGYSSYAGHLRLPVTLGHEFCGEVVQVGSKLNNVNIGDIVVAEQIRWCGKCPVCRKGMFNQCMNLEEVGLSVDGAFSEYAVVPEKYICIANELLDIYNGDKIAAFEAGALVEPAAVAYSGIVINAGGVKPGATTVVFGCGPIGLACIALLKAFGVAEVIAFNTNPARDYLAQRMGADVVLNPKELKQSGSSAADFVMKQTKGLGAEMLIEATGKYSMVYQEMVNCMAAGAKIVQLGIGSEPLQFDAGELLRKNAHIVGSLGHAGNGIFPSVLRMMETGRIDMRKMITGRFNLDDCEKAIYESGRRELGHGKVIVSSYYKSE